MTDFVNEEHRPVTAQKKMERFGVVAAFLIVGLAILQSQHGALQVIGLAVGLPIILVLLVLAVRIYRGRESI